MILTVFRSRLRPEHAEEYAVVAARMEALACTMPGFISITIFFLFVVAATSCGADQFATFSTLDGQTYTNAELTELTPKGAVLHSDSGVATIPYGQLPKVLQARYGYDAPALIAVLAAGIDGTYSFPGFAMTGEVIAFKGDEFTYETFNDAVDTPGPIRGKFKIDGNWLFLRHKNVFCPARILAVIDGHLAIFRPNEYKQWKDSGDRVLSHGPLYPTPPTK